MVRSTQPDDQIISRRSLIAAAVGGAFTPIILAGCSPKSADFNSIDLTGAAYAKDFRLKDHFGNIRTLADSAIKSQSSFSASRNARMFVQLP